MTTRRGGPLDSLLDEEDRGPLQPVHGRVLALEEEDGLSLTLVCWNDPGGALALHRILRTRVEAAILAEMFEGRDPRPTSLRFVALEPIAGVDDAVRAFGLQRRDDEPRFKRTLAAVRGEASALGLVAERAEIFEAKIAAPNDLARRVEVALAQGAQEVFGARPGALAARLAASCESLGVPIAPSATGLATLENALFPREIEVIRFVPGRVFAAVCDVIAVLAASQKKLPIEWAIADDAPPLVRFKARGQTYHVPLGEELLRFAVMPIRSGEEVPSLVDFAFALFD